MNAAAFESSAWVILLLLVLFAVLAHFWWYSSNSFGSFGSFGSEWQIAESEEPPQPELLTELLQENFASCGSKGAFEYPEMTTRPLDLPVWVFGGAGVDSTYDTGTSQVVQSPQPMDPTSTSPRDNPMPDWVTRWTAPYGTDRRDALDVTPSPSFPDSGGAPMPVIALPVETGSNSEVVGIEGERCKFSADSGYVC